MGGRVHARVDGAIGWIVFDHPERRNAVSVEMWAAIPRAAQQLAGENAVRVVVMRGAGEDAFVSGADISEFAERRSGETAGDYDAAAARAAAALHGIEKPLLAMIHGFCGGAGVGIALGADLRYAADDASFAVPAARLGLGYPARGFEELSRLVGSSRALEIFFTARRFGADEALQMGLVNRLAPKADLEREVREIAAGIAGNAPLTLASIKLISRQLAREPAARDHGAIEASIRACFESEDYREGTRAFLEKRAPRFRGR